MCSYLAFKYAYYTPQLEAPNSDTAYTAGVQQIRREIWSHSAYTGVCHRCHCSYQSTVTIYYGVPSSENELQSDAQRYSALF
jgi:hypothetical protein